MIEHWDKILYLAGILVAFVTGNKSKKIAEKGSQLDNLIKYQQMYERFSVQFEAQLTALEFKVENLELRNAIIVEEAQDWKEKFSKLQKLYDKLKGEFEALKKKHQS